jgi:hypothetical protein
MEEGDRAGSPFGRSMRHASFYEQLTCIVIDPRSKEYDNAANSNDVWYAVDT